MNIYVFGNSDHPIDSIAFKLLDQLRTKFPEINFIVVYDPQSEFHPIEKNPVIIDAAEGIDKVTLIDDLDKIDLPVTSSMHDFDLGFNLKFMKKIGKIDGVKIIAVPMTDKVTDDQLDKVRSIVEILK